MINPTPMLPPSPIEISGFFTSAFEAMKRRLGLFVLIVLFPSLLMLAVCLICLLLVGGLAATGNQSAIGTGVVLAIVVFIAGVVTVWLAQLKSQAMMTQAAYEVAQNQQPTFSGVLRNTKGFLPRFLPLIAIGFGVGIAYTLLLGTVMFSMISAASSSSRSNAAGAAALIFILLIVATVPVAFWLSVKLLYVVPACTIECLGGIDSLKRSWSLTKGSFWRTFGYSILPGLAVYVLTFIVNSVTQAITGPVASQFDLDNLSPAQIAAALLVALPAFGITLALQLAVQLLTTPFLQSYYAYMFIDQVHRSEMPAQPYGYAPQPGYGYPGGYPQQGYPQAPQQPQYPGQQQYTGQQQYPGEQYGQQPPQQQWPQNPQPGHNGQPGSSQNQWPGQN